MIIQKEGHRYFIEHWNLPYWNRYDNPFEKKWSLKEKFNLPINISALINLLDTQYDNLSQIFEANLKIDLERHYHGIFRYQLGDYLNVHVDAGINPITKLRKHVTAIMYLTESVLELWSGSNCTNQDKRVTHVTELIDAKPGTVIYFENNDFAWHGVSPVYQLGKERILITASFMSEEINIWSNIRQRAFFVPRPNEIWSEDIEKLRDVRSDSERYAEVYRV